MSKWQNYFATLGGSRVAVFSQKVGQVHGSVRDIMDTTLFLSPLGVPGLAEGDAMRVQFVDSKLKQLRFFVVVRRVLDNRIEVQMTGFEHNLSFFPLAELQNYWEKHIEN